MFENLVLIIDVICITMVSYTTFSMLSERQSLVVNRSLDVAIGSGFTILIVLILNFVQVLSLH